MPTSFFDHDCENRGPALHKAVENARLDVIDVLLASGADVTLRNAKGRTAYKIAKYSGMDAEISCIAIVEQRLLTRIMLLGELEGG